jgi:hypothetical protein
LDIVALKKRMMDKNKGLDKGMNKCMNKCMNKYLNADKPFHLDSGFASNTKIKL